MAHAPALTLHGLMAEYDTPTALVEAATKARLAGYRKMDAYSPIPIHELDEALGLKRTRLPLLVLLGGIFGGIGGFTLESWASAIAYPMNVGGRPLISWPQFIPVTFETTVLGAACGHSTNCRSRITRSSTLTRSRGPRRIGSSWWSKSAIPGSTGRRRGISSSPRTR
jgi:Alternative complex III, ActD subunit